MTNVQTGYEERRISEPDMRIDEPEMRNVDPEMRNVNPEMRNVDPETRNVRIRNEECPARKWPETFGLA